MMPRLYISLVICISMAFSFSSAALPLASDQVPIAAQAPLPLTASQNSYPALLKYIDSSQPDYIAPNAILIPGSPFWAYYGGQANPPYRLDSLLKFTDIPDGANTCQLQWAFPAGWSVSVWGVGQLNVYTVDREAEDGDSWNNSPNEVSLWGTTTLQSGGSGIVNSESCNGTLSFRIEISRDSGGQGRVAFSQSNGQSQWGQPAAGWFLTYNT
jgi:hypothetical protein